MKKLVRKLISPRKWSAYELSVPAVFNTRDVEKAFVRLFETNDGKKVLAYLQAVTFMRAAQMDAPNEMLRYMEGQRSLVALIQRMIERGKFPLN